MKEMLEVVVHQSKNKVTVFRLCAISIFSFHCGLGMTSITEQHSVIVMAVGLERTNMIKNKVKS